MSTEPAYAFLDEIWGERETSRSHEPACSGAKGKLDDIMDVYIKDGDRKKDPVIRMGVGAVDQEDPSNANAYNRRVKANVEGYNVSPSSFLKSAYEYSSFYDDSVEMAKRQVVDQEEKEAIAICNIEKQEQAESNAAALTREEIYRDVVERFAASQKSAGVDIQYIELAIYLFSGIFIIFVLEQILHIGKNMR
jgi:hypothetical protein